MLLAERAPGSHPPLRVQRAALAPFAEDTAELLRVSAEIAT